MQVNIYDVWKPLSLDSEDVMFYDMLINYIIHRVSLFEDLSEYIIITREAAL